jgi:hypothetical protein
MSISLVEFKKNLSNIVRPNRFLVYITPPASLTEGMDTDVLKFYAQSAAIPDRNFNEIQIKYYGMEYKIPASEVGQDLMVNFILDEEWKVRDFFESWSQLINNRDNSRKGYAEDLFDGTFIEIHQLGFTGNVLAKYGFVNPFPKTVDQMELGMETVDSHSSFQVIFAYSYWERLNVGD